MENIVTVGMTKKEWLRARHGHIGGSEIGAVLGLNKYRSALELYTEKTAPEPTEIDETPKMRAGKRQEQLIADYYADVAQREVEIDGVIRIHPQHSFASVSLDRIIVDNGDGRGPGVLEAKNTTSMYASTWETDVPLPYYAQIQWGMLVSGYSWGAVAVQIDGWDLKITAVEADKDFQEMMLGEAREFWTNMQAGIPPAPTVKDLDAMTPKGGSVVASDDNLRACEQLLKIKAEQSALEKEEKALKDTVKLSLGESENLIRDDIIIATYRTTEVKESFRQAYRYRSLDIKKPKKAKQ